MSTRPYPVLTARGAKETDNRPNEAFLGYYPKSFHIRKGFCIDHARDYTHYHPTDPMVLEDTSFAVVSIGNHIGKLSLEFQSGLLR